MTEPGNPISIAYRWWRRSPAGLYAASFFFAMGISITLIAVPWQVMALGGREFAVGAIGLQWLAYTVACLALRPLIDRLKRKRLIITSLLISLGLLAAMPMAPSVVVLLALTSIFGLVMSGFWPVVVGWISAADEGSTLNRRLGIFNLSWSVGNILGAFLGGLLFGIAHWLPFAAAACAAGLAAVLVLTLREGRRTAPAPATETEDLSHASQLLLFRRISRLGVLIGFTAAGVLRIPIASLIKEMSLGPGLHGSLGAGISFIMLCCFFMLGRWSAWHYRFVPVILAQVVLAAAIGAVGFCYSAGALALCVFVAVPSMTFAYSSHLYYSVSGHSKRSAGAATHEAMVSLGVLIGSFGGGVLARQVNIRAVYFVTGVAIAGFCVVQAAIYAHGRMRATRQRSEIRNPIPARREDD